MDKALPNQRCNNWEVSFEKEHFGDGYALEVGGKKRFSCHVERERNFGKCTSEIR